MSHCFVTCDHHSGKTCCVNRLPFIGERAGPMAAKPRGEWNEDLAISGFAGERCLYSRSYERMLSKGYFVEWLALAW